MNRIDCAQARELLLEADLDELTNDATPLARHVAECTKCAALAKALVEGYASLEDGLAAMATKRTIQKGRTRKHAWAVLPLAAAAALVMILARGENTPLTQPTFLAQLMFPEQTQVDPPAGKQAVIIEKNDLTVVWLY